MRYTFLFICLFLMTNVMAVQDGTLDPLFGTNGGVITLIGNAHYVPNPTRVQPDGKIVIAGRRVDGGSGAICGFIIRYNQDGTLDTSFGNGGEVIACVPGGTMNATDMVIQPDGKFIISCMAPLAGADTLILFRFLPDGSPDLTFGVNGMASVFIHAGGVAREFAMVALQHDGKIVVASTTSSTNQAVLARLLTNGTLDTTFGVNGIVPLTTYGGVYTFYFGVQVQNDDKIVVIGNFSPDGVHDTFLVARYLTNGTLDSSFAIDGVNKSAVSFVGTLPGGFGDGSVISVGAAGGAIQADGKIVVYGSDGSAPPLTVARYGTDGELDRSFANSGVGTYFSLGNIIDPNCLRFQSDGKIIVLSGANVGGTPAENLLATIRLNVDGTIDESFGDAGTVMTFIVNTPNCQPRSAAIGPKDGIIVTATATLSNDHIGIAQYTIDSIKYSPLSLALWKRYYNQE